ncbi:hypothetical protein [Polymorphospora rubra]|uniref:hypothetical protein n=1 Tax=Polymorphospora rubra TaxID=338584 RepID=UPI0033F2807E
MRHHDQQLTDPDVVRSHPVPVPEQDGAPDRTAARRDDEIAPDPRDEPGYDTERRDPNAYVDDAAYADLDATDAKRNPTDPTGDHKVDGRAAGVNGFRDELRAVPDDTVAVDDRPSAGAGPEPDPVPADDRPDTGDDRPDTVAVDDDRTEPTGADRTDAGPAGGAGLMPGDVPGEPVAVLIPADAAQALRERWREVQLRFVDDPRAAAGEAQDLVEEAVQALAAALAAQKDDLGGWRSSGDEDTERLRVTVRRYRDFLDRLLDT